MSSELTPQTPRGWVPDDEAEDVGFPLREYWGVIRKRFWTILLVAGLVTGLGTVHAINQQDVYQAVVTVEIRTEAPRFLGADVEPVVDPAAGARYWSTAEYYETQYRVIRSRAVAERVVEALQLGENLEFLGIDPDSDPEVLRQALERADPVERLINMTSVNPVPESQLVEIQVENTNPELAALLAQTIADVYVERNMQRQLRGTYEAFEWLENERETSREAVDDAEAALLSFRQDHDINTASLEDRQDQLTDHLRSVNDLLTEAQAEVSATRTEVRRIRRARDDSATLDAIAVPAVIENPLIQQLKQQREQLSQEADRLSAEYGTRHPELRGVSDALAQVEAAIDREINVILDSFEERLARAEARESELATERDNIRAEMTGLSQAEPVYNQLERDITIAADIMAMLARRYKETDLYRRQQDVNNIEVLDAAVVPDHPVRPRRRLIVAVAMVLGTVLGVGLAFLVELLDNTVRTQEDVERNLGFTFLGVVPSIKSGGRERAGRAEEEEAKPDLYIHENPKSTVAECCRSIRTNLHFMSPDRPLRRLLVTSAGPREGKTSTAINLATVMAQSNQRVLLVDTDMRRPRLHRAFGFGNEIGLTNLMLGEVDYEEAIRPTEVPRLDVLSCGPIPPNPTELMHTERFRTIVEALSERYDRVIFDSPPVIAVADAMILANMADGVLFVIKTGQTSREVVRRAKSLLEGINAPLLGAVLNDLDLEDRAYRYHYYYSYYYRYGQYYEEREPDGDRSPGDEGREAPASPRS